MGAPKRPFGAATARDIYWCTTPIRFVPFREEARMAWTLDGLLGGGAGSVPVKGVTCDSRKVRPGFVFVAIRGSRADGRAFVEDAVRRGCAAVVAESPPQADPGVPVVVVPDARSALAEIAGRFHGDPTSRLNAVGVTGTKGKTTTAYLVRSILEAAGERSGLLGTVQYVIGGRVEPAPLTTPSADELQRYLAEMLAAGSRSAVMEISSIALDQRRTHAMRLAAGVFTNLTRDHLDYHGSVDAYRDAKSRLFEQLPGRAIAVLNADDPASEVFAARTRARVVRYALEAHSGADVRGRVETMTFRGMRLRMALGSEELMVATRLVGRHNARNVLAASATVWAMGYDFEHIRSGVEALVAVPGRLEAVDEGQPFAVFVDYAHTEDSLRNVLGCLRELSAGLRHAEAAVAPAAQAGSRGRLLLVFGCGGDRDRGKRPLMGRAAEELSDFFIVTSDNPRGEDPRTIIRDIEEGISNPSKYLVEPDRAAAIRVAVGMARPGDIVLIAGKGHETYQIVGEATRPFDDREHAREAVRRTERARARGGEP